MFHTSRDPLTNLKYTETNLLPQLGVHMNGHRCYAEQKARE
jgi:hypothetical protein